MAVKLPPALFFVSPRWWSAAALCLLALALVLAFAAPAALADDDDDRSTRDSFRDSDRSGDPSSARYSRFIAGEFARDEVIATRVTPAQLAALRERGYAVLEQRSDGLINAITARLRVPGRLTLDQALAEIASLNAESVADRNHFYRAIGGASSCDGPHCATANLIEWPAAGASCPRRARVTIGLIDTGIQRDHPALAQQAIDIVQMRPGERRASGTGHGTAIASLLVGARDGPAPGLMPDARLIAIDAFYRGSFSDDRMDAYQLEAAIEELIKRGARVLNFSFAGPSNRVLELGVAAAYKKGAVMVAAVGNDGARAEPRFPAAYPQVIAVTAVRQDTQVYRHAVQGKHVALAAHGVDIWAARAGDAGGTKFSGTSFAAPQVTAAAALLLARSPGLSNEAVKRALIGATKDLGAGGVDPVYGHGLLKAAALCGEGARAAGGG
jgi:hypothetical protein